MDAAEWMQLEWMQLSGYSAEWMQYGVDAAWMQGAGCRRVDAAIKLEVAEWMQC